MTQYEPGSQLIAPFQVFFRTPHDGYRPFFPGEPITKGLKIKYDFNTKQGYLNESTNTYFGYYSINNIDPQYSSSIIYCLIETEYFHNIEMEADIIYSNSTGSSEYNTININSNGRKENVSIVTIHSTESKLVYYSIDNQNYNDGYVIVGSANSMPGIIPLYKGQNLYYKYNNGVSDVYGELLNIQEDSPIIDL